MESEPSHRTVPLPMSDRPPNPVNLAAIDTAHGRFVREHRDTGRKSLVRPGSTVATTRPKRLGSSRERAQRAPDPLAEAPDRAVRASTEACVGKRGVVIGFTNGATISTVLLGAATAASGSGTAAAGGALGSGG